MHVIEGARVSCNCAIYTLIDASMALAYTAAIPCAATGACSGQM